MRYKLESQRIISDRITRPTCRLKQCEQAGLLGDPADHDFMFDLGLTSNRSKYEHDILRNRPSGLFPVLVVCAQV
jgi:hypothetical protein